MSPDKPVLIDRYMEGKECEVDAICDGEGVLIPGVMEHVERAGVHSGDSMAIYPGLNLTESEVDTIVDYTTRIGLALGVRGLMNVQFVIHGGAAYRSPQTRNANSEETTVYVLEVNPARQPHHTLHLQGHRRTCGPAGDAGNAGVHPGRGRLSHWLVA